MSDSSTNPQNPTQSTQIGADELQRLYRMSRTAGLGNAEYVAVNGMAVAALVFGLASGLLLVSSVLWVIPAICIVFAVVAFRQISNSNGTQTGRGLAILGVLIAVGVGLLQGGRAVASELARRKDAPQIDAIVAHFGELLAANKDEEAYKLFNQRFTTRVPSPRFNEMWHMIRISPFYGEIKGADGNGLYDFEIDPSTDEKLATGLVKFRFTQTNERHGIIFRQINGQWTMENIPDYFSGDAPATSQPARPGPSIQTVKTPGTQP